MIECIFTLDYEIFGNGEGSLREHVLEPTDRLISIFKKHNMRFVAFIEAAEFELMAMRGADRDIHSVFRQVRQLHDDGFEIGLHLHPQWYNARYENNHWCLDYQEYNLCLQSQKRIAEIVNRSIGHLRFMLNDPAFTPISFRAGNWLFQPTRILASELASQGIKIDSSVYKGGLQRQFGLDYRRSLNNGYYWKFNEDVNVPDSKGSLFEFPIHTKMVPLARIITKKRMNLQHRSSYKSFGNIRSWQRYLDSIRLRHPLKFDYCRLPSSELNSWLAPELIKDIANPSQYRPIVAIGHTKDFIDDGSTESLLASLISKEIPVSCFRDAIRRILTIPLIP